MKGEPFIITNNETNIMESVVLLKHSGQIKYNSAATDVDAMNLKSFPDKNFFMLFNLR